MRRRHPLDLPCIWLVSDARNDEHLPAIIAGMPRGSGLIFRHYHLSPRERRVRFAQLARIARARGFAVVLAGGIAEARHWRADGAYGPPERLARGTAGQSAMIRLATAHSLAEIAAARRVRADAILLSPAFATTSHPGARPLGPLRWRMLVMRAGLPVIALGGMDAKRARRLGAARWAAISGIWRKPSRNQDS